MDVNELLHHQRSAHVSRIPRGDTLLSAGCAGAWYFEWIEKYYGAVDRHIGLEFYMPKPDTLPENVEWIANTVGDMCDVPDDSVDVIFSGQNLEHLWLRDMVAFFCEASRVLRDGGHLVMDSPNRTQTEALCWPHPEHTAELTVDEAVQAFELAGFEITKKVGLWLIEGPSGTYEYEPADDADQITRVIDAIDQPQKSFCWWIEAKRTSQPDRAGLEKHLEEVFKIAWPERLQRFRVLGAMTLPGSGDLVNEIGYPSIVMFGPYTPLPWGEFEVTFSFRGVDLCTSSPGSVDVMVNEQVVAVAKIPAIQADEETAVTVPFTLTEDMNFGVQFRVESTGETRFRTKKAVTLIDHSAAESGPAYDRSKPTSIQPK